MHKMVAEAFGTFALVFAGTTAIVVNDLSQGAITHVGVAMTFGLIVMVMIYAVGDISGAHLNPAVTIGFWLARRLPRHELLPYICSQIAGALVASAFVKTLFAAHLTLGATRPAGSVAQSFAVEILLTLLLMFTILSVSGEGREKAVSPAIAIGAVVGLAALIAGPVSGASMNPARSLGPALISGQLQYIWVYLLAPSLGAGIAVFACRCTRGKQCCGVAATS